MNLHVTRQFGHPASLFLRGWCACKPEILGSSIKLCSAVPTLAARWLRFFCYFWGVTLNQTLVQSLSFARRPLDLSVGFADVTADRMKRCLTAFEAWVSCELGIPWNKIEQDPHAFCFALRVYGLHCFEIGLPRYISARPVPIDKEFHGARMADRSKMADP